jgi:8-oxo-dGTP pyrophosphatase MutT (NUDIX family)
MVEAKRFPPEDGREFFNLKPVSGARGLIYVAPNAIIVSRRDGKGSHPFKNDLPGGTAEEGETGCDAFIREVGEELGIVVERHEIISATMYPSESKPDLMGFFVVADLSARRLTPSDIKFGSEGLGFSFVHPYSFITDPNAIRSLRAKTMLYIAKNKVPNI